MIEFQTIEVQITEDTLQTLIANKLLIISNSNTQVSATKSFILSDEFSRPTLLIGLKCRHSATKYVAFAQKCSNLW